LSATVKHPKNIIIKDQYSSILSYYKLDFIQKGDSGYRPVKETVYGEDLEDFAAGEADYFYCDYGYD